MSHRVRVVSMIFTLGFLSVQLSVANAAMCDFMRQVCEEAGPHSNRCKAQRRLWAEKCEEGGEYAATFGDVGASENGVSKIERTSSRISNCPQNLSHVAGQLPRYREPDLEEMRNTILSTDIPAALESALAMGFTPSSAASAAFEQADLSEAKLPIAAKCLIDSSFDEQHAVRQLEGGTYDFGTAGIPESCAKTYVLSYYSMIANREAAIEIACLARERR